VTGLLLANNGILLADAISGQVTKMPNVPYAAPRQDVPPQAPNNQGSNGAVQPIQTAPPDVQASPGVVQPSPDVQPPNATQPPQK